jgi:hypothetical protein
MARPALTPPDWATSGVYADPGEPWHGAARVDAAILALLAPDGAHPAEPTPATGINAFLQQLTRVCRYVMQESAGIGVGRYGDGSDGDVDIGVGTTTLTRDMYYNNLTVPVGGVLSTAGFRVFVKETFTLAGSVLCDGNAANLGVAGNGAPHRAGVGALATFYQGGVDGAAGISAANTNGNAASTSFYQMGGTGGGGGISGGGESGGGFGGLTPAATRGGFRHYPDALELRSEIPADAGVVVLLGGGGGGGSGGNDASGGGNISGAGGGGAGVIGICARQLLIAATGLIRARGGNGGNATSGSGAGAGGGGGGGGGRITLIGDYLENLGSITAPGGNGGNGAIGGAAGQAGFAGVIVNLYPD